jgi:hypothetical protein
MMRRITSFGSAMIRSLAYGAVISSGKQSTPPAVSISSATQRIPEM